MTERILSSHPGRRLADIERKIEDLYRRARGVESEPSRLTPGRIMYVGPTRQPADDAMLLWDRTLKRMTVETSGTEAIRLLKASATSGAWMALWRGATEMGRLGFEGTTGGTLLAGAPAGATVLQATNALTLAWGGVRRAEGVGAVFHFFDAAGVSRVRVFPDDAVEPGFHVGAGGEEIHLHHFLGSGPERLATKMHTGDQASIPGMALFKWGSGTGRYEELRLIAPLITGAAGYQAPYVGLTAASPNAVQKPTATIWNPDGPISITGQTVTITPNPTPAAHVHSHGGLTGLTGDDHTQYAKKASAETISGAWSRTNQESWSSGVNPVKLGAGAYCWNGFTSGESWIDFFEFSNQSASAGQIWEFTVNWGRSASYGMVTSHTSGLTNSFDLHVRRQWQVNSTQSSHIWSTASAQTVAQKIGRLAIN